MSARRLGRSFFARDARVVAPELIGLWLVKTSIVDGKRRRAVARIVETEAYQGPEDLAAHSARGRRTARTETMFGPPGHAYVYFIYGMHHCFNVVTAPREVPHAVLIRALEPLTGIVGDTRGPGRLCRTLGISREDDGRDLLGPGLYLQEPPGPTRAPRIGRAARVGVDYAGDWASVPWRFYEAGSRFVSKPTPG